MNIKKFIKRIVCLGISSVLITSNSFAGKIINNPSKKSQKQLKNNTQKSRKDLLLEKIRKLTPNQKKNILFEALGWGSSVLNVFLIKKLWNILFPTRLEEPENQVKDNTNDPKNKDKSNQNIRDNCEKKSPFANLEWKNNNCYIDATLQILYEDSEFRQYVRDQASAFVFNSSCNLSEENAKLAYNNLSQIFKDMDKYTGGTVSHDQIRQGFETALGHNGKSDSAGQVLAKLYMPNSFLGLCDNHETDSIEISGFVGKDNCTNMDMSGNFLQKDISQNSLWFTCNAISKDNRKSLPLELTFKNNKKFKLKGVVVYEPGHYNAYKTDSEGNWYFIDDYYRKNVPRQIQNLKAVYMGYNIKTDEAESSSGVELAYYQAV